MTRAEPIVFPILFFIVLFVLAGLIAPFVLRLLRIPIPAKSTGLLWSILGDALILLISLLIVNVYHLGMIGYIIVAIIFIIISVCIASFFYYLQRKD